MGYINEETKHEDIDATIKVIQREKGETTDPWRFIALDVDMFGKLTPVELRNLGHWFVKQGKRLGREYKSNGAPKKCPPSTTSSTASSTASSTSTALAK